MPDPQDVASHVCHLHTFVNNVYQDVSQESIRVHNIIFSNSSAATRNFFAQDKDGNRLMFGRVPIGTQEVSVIFLATNGLQIGTNVTDAGMSATVFYSHGQGDYE